MNKKILILFLGMIFLVSTISAWCYDYSHRQGNAYAYTEVCGTDPQCDGKLYGRYCVGEWYTLLSHQGDEFYLRYLTPSWETCTSDMWGLHCSNLIPVSDGKYYLKNENGKIPKFILLGYDYNEAPNGDYAWASMQGGYLGTEYFGANYYQVHCYNNEDCGASYYCDKSGEWESWNCQYAPPTTNIDVYRLINNQCVFMTINSNNRQSNDYDSLSICEQYITTPPVNGDNGDGDNGNGDNGDETSTFSPDIIVIIIIGVIAVLLTFILIRRRRR